MHPYKDELDSPPLGGGLWNSPADPAEVARRLRLAGVANATVATRKTAMDVLIARFRGTLPKFEYIDAIDRGGKTFVVIVQGGTGIILDEAEDIFPSDAMMGKLRALAG